MNSNEYSANEIAAFAAKGYTPPGMTNAITFDSQDPPLGGDSAVTPEKPEAIPASGQVFVQGEAEEWIARTGNRIDEEAKRKAQLSAPPGQQAAVYFIEEESDQKVMTAYDELAQRYKEMQGLEHIPRLEVPQMNTSYTGFPLANQTALLNKAWEKLAEMKEKASLVCVVDDDKPKNAMELEKMLLNSIILIHCRNDVYWYTGQVYRLLTSNELQTRINLTLHEEICKAGTPHLAETIACAVKIDPFNVVDVMEEPEDRIALQNGVLCLTTMELENFSPEWLFTSQRQISWDPYSTCPLFDEYLYGVVGGDLILLQRFWEFMAYVLYVKGQPAKKFMVMVGKGNEGKSVLGEVLMSFFDPDRISSISATQMGRGFGNQSILNKDLNINMDLSAAPLSCHAIGFLKAAVGRDSLEISRKHTTGVRTRVDTKIVFGSNSLLRFEEKDEACKARIMYLPFQYPVPKERQDTSLSKRLIKERNGIFYKASFYYQQLRSRNYQFSGDERVNEIISSLFADNVVASETELLEMFVDTHIEVDPEGFVSSKDLLDSYLSYSKNAADVGQSYRRNFFARLKKILEENYRAKNGKKRVHDTSDAGEAKKPVSGYFGIRFMQTE